MPKRAGQEKGSQLKELFTGASVLGWPPISLAGWWDSDFLRGIPLRLLGMHEMTRVGRALGVI